jgi:beta-lactamase class A
LNRSYSLTVVIVLTIITFGLGFGLSKFLPDSKAHKKSNPTQESQQFSSILNPILPYVAQTGLDFGELRSFRPKIEALIAKSKAEHPELQVSYYFRDLNNGLWSGINERETFSPASLFKLPLLIAFLKKAETQPEILKLGFTYHAKDFENVEEEAGFKKEEGKYYTTEDMLQQMIEYSDNAASLVLLNYVGDTAIIKVIKDMNITIGSGYNEKTNFVTVKAYASIFRVLYNCSYLNKEMSEKALKLMMHARYQKGIRGAIPPQIAMAHKYGKRDEMVPGSNNRSLQLHHFALIYHPQKPFLLGIMTKGNNLALKEKLIHDLAALTYEEVDKQCKEKKLRGVFSE